MTKARKLKYILRTIIILVVLINVVAAIHAYKFTHFTNEFTEKTGHPENLSTVQKLKTLLLGVNNPRPVNKTFSTQKYETIYLKSNKVIECWSINADSSKGTVVIFHGYGGNKSLMLDKSDIFLSLGYNTLLVDFMGSGGSEGNQTTVGFMEAEQVKTSVDYLKSKGENRIYLFGTSMGAVAVMKAVNDYALMPEGVIVECPFGSMYQTVCARFSNMKVPAFPMAGLLVFWGGIENGFWAFKHCPTEYAKNISCPTLLMYGEKDKNVSKKEIDAIFANLKGEKELITYPLAGHENYLFKYKDEWTKDVQRFIEK